MTSVILVTSTLSCSLCATASLRLSNATRASVVLEDTRVSSGAEPVSLLQDTRLESGGSRDPAVSRLLRSLSVLDASSDRHLEVKSTIIIYNNAPQCYRHM